MPNSRGLHSKKEEKNTISIDDINKNKLFDDIYKQISGNTYKNPMDNLQQLDAIDAKINDILTNDVDPMKEQSSDSLSMFLSQTLSNSDRGFTKGQIQKLNTGNPELEEFLNSKDGGVFEMFNERFRNKLLLYNDLEIIAEQLTEITEALETTRDDICCADEVGVDIARSLNFITETEDSDEYDNLIKQVKEMEKRYSLNKKIREHIVPKTLKYGEYYAYVIPESKLFEKAQTMRKRTSTGAMLESSEINLLQENLKIDNPNYDENKRNSEATITPTAEELTEYISENFQVCNDEIALPLLEANGVNEGYMDYVKFNKLDNILGSNKNSKKKNKKDDFNFGGFSDGVKASNKLDDWTSVKGVYIKLIDPKKIIPVKVMDYIIGYYYISDTNYAPSGVRNRPGQQFSTLCNGNLMNLVANKTAGERNIITTIASSIVKSLDKKYLEQNKEFKDLIINALQYNDLYKRKVHFQFIPADYICRFTVNEDENGDGQSILWKSLFYAKLYLSILIFNVISFLAKSQDTRIHYIKNSGINKNGIDKTMKLARQIKEKQISIADLMDYSAIYGKIGTGRDIFMPVGESGERGIEFDVISGQQIDMQNDFMEQLKHGYISATGVPSVLTTYINEIDFAKTLVMANAKHMRRIMFYQSSFNESITKFYKMIMLYSTDIDHKTISEFEYKLSRPRSLPNANMTDMITYGDQMMDFIIKAVYGENATGDENEEIEKEIFRSKLSREILAVLPWEIVDNIKKETSIERAERDAKMKANGGAGDTSSDMDSEY